jgi:chaperone required for assembly of F1-ATPase
MRDIFDQISGDETSDPNAAARRAMRPQLRQRFYREASFAETDNGFAITLDGKVVRTPVRRALVAPTRELAQAMAAEWNAQEEFVDPARMPLTRLANSILDGVVDAPSPVAAAVADYLGCDLLFYRARGPQGLRARQAQHWDPVLAWVQATFGVRFVLAEGVSFVAQPPPALAAVRAAFPADAWQIGALNSITTLTGSALLALALWRGAISREEAWAAAHVDEDWNMDQWGRDAIALARRAARFAEFEAAAKVLQLVAGAR